MDKLGGENIGQRTSVRKVALASLIGTTIEWYDFFLYGTAAAVVFGPLFFPNFSSLAGTLAAFSTFAVGFIARPIGAFFFGHYGDKIGRKSMLVATLLIMGIATFLIGLLPTHATIGIWAPILLVTLRILQGFGVGGEWGGAVLMVVEHSSEGKRGFHGSIPGIGALAGFLLSTGVFATVAALPQEQFLAWGWRLPFLLSIILVGVGLFIRLRVMETPAFTRVKETNSEARMPLFELIRTYRKNILLVMGARFAENGTFYIFSIFAIAYGSGQLGLPPNTILLGVAIAAAIEILTIPAFGFLSDVVGRRPVYVGGAAFSALFAFPFFWLVSTKETPLIYLALILALAVGHGAMFGPQSAFFSELFGTRVRYSGVAIGHGLASVFAGGLSPLIATALLAWSGGDPWPVAIYIVVMALITFVSVYLAAETFRGDLVE